MRYVKSRKKCSLNLEISDMNSRIATHSVLLTSYMRPELTKRTLDRTINWSGLKKLIVVIDGLRLDANEEEKKWRELTIEVVENYKKSEKLELWCYTTNIGMTEHYLRIQERVMNEDPDTIWIEEDIDLDFDKFARLKSEKHYNQGPVLISGYSHFNHKDTVENGLKGNLFVPMWGLRMNEAFHELICKIWKDKSFNEKYVEHALLELFPVETINQRMYTRSVMKYWKEYSKWGLFSSRRWDSLANYALWTIGRVSLASMNRLAEDVSYLDFRGMNQRVKPSEVLTHLSSFKKVRGIEFCIECEMEGSRKSPLIRRRIRDSLDYRLRKKVTRISS